MAKTFPLGYLYKYLAIKDFYYTFSTKSFSSINKSTPLQFSRNIPFGHVMVVGTFSPYPEKKPVKLINVECQSYLEAKPSKTWGESAKRL